MIKSERGYETVHGYKTWLSWAIEQSMGDLRKDRRKQRPTSTVCESERLCKIYFDVDFFCSRTKKESHAFCKPCQAEDATFRKMLLKYANVEHYLSNFACGHDAASITWKYCGNIRPVLFANGARAPACGLHACFPCLRKKDAHDANFYAFVLCYRAMQKQGIISRAHMNRDLARIVFRFYEMNDVLENGQGTHYLDDKPGEYRYVIQAIERTYRNDFYGCPMNYFVCQAQPLKFCARIFAVTGQCTAIREAHCSRLMCDGSKYCFRCLHACEFDWKVRGNKWKCDGLIMFTVDNERPLYCQTCTMNSQTLKN